MHDTFHALAGYFGNSASIATAKVLFGKMFSGMLWQAMYCGHPKVMSSAHQVTGAGMATTLMLSVKVTYCVSVYKPCIISI